MKLIFILLSTLIVNQFSLESWAMSVSDFTQMVRTQNIKSTDELLLKLPPAFRNNFTMIYKSEALHALAHKCYSTQYPRVISFSVEDEAVLAFGGDPRNPNCQNTEVMAINPKTLQWEGGEILFAQGGLNSQACIACHTTSENPIWKSYSRWSGVYGSDDDLLEKPSPWNHSAPSIRQSEFQTFQHYKAMWKVTPGYRSLSWDTFQRSNPIFPYGEVRTGPLSQRPNARLGMMLGQLQGRAMAIKLLSNPQIFASRFQIAAGQLTNGSYQNVCNMSSFHALISNAQVYALIKQNSSMAPEAMKKVLLENPTLLSNEDREYTVDFFDGLAGSGYLSVNVLHQVFKLVLENENGLKPYLHPWNFSHQYGQSAQRQLFPDIDSQKFVEWLRKMRPEINLPANEAHALCTLLGKRTG